MEIQQSGLGISYNHTLKADKHFFGGFLNLAINNLESLLYAFKIKFDITGNVSTKNFAETCFKKSIDDHSFEVRLSFLSSYFPIVNYLDFRNRENFKKELLLLFDTIEQLRSFYTHYYHPPICISDDLCELLDHIFVRVASDVRENKVKNDKSRHLLKKTLSEELSIRYDLQIEKLKQLKKEGKKVNLKDEDAVRNGVLNSSFKHLIFKNDKGEEQPTRRFESKYSEMDFAENGIIISQSGLLFFTSFFLKRKEIEDLKSRVKGFKAKIIKNGEEEISGLKYMATHWVFSYLCFKEVKQNLNSEFDRETLLIQIIDELSKVPHEVYSAFDKETQDLFIEDINEYLKEGNADYTLEEAKVIHPVIRKRYEDKFNYFVIRYLDEFVGFKSLRFQIHLGNYIHDKRTKNIAGTGFQTERIIKERIKVFGKLSDAQKLKNEFFTGESKLNNHVGWEILPNPSYIFIDNNVPIYLKVDQEVKDEVKAARNRRKAIQPDERRDRSSDKAQKYAIVNEISKNNLLRKDEPTALLSLNEIPSLLYELLIKDTSADSIEEILKSRVIESVRTIRDYNPENPLPASRISKRIRNNNANDIHINTDKLKHLLTKEVFLTDEKLNIIYKNRTELGKKVQGKILRKFIFGFSELGREAAWLSQDIKRFMPAPSRKDWKGYQHSQLQQSFSYYESRPNEAYKILEDGWNFDDESILWNKWIKISFKEKFFDKFYERYLLGRKEYLQNVLINLENFNFTSNKFIIKFLSQQLPKNFFDKRLYVLESLQQEKNKILSYPMVFPRGLFDPNPTFVKGVKITDEPEKFAEWYRYGYSDKHTFQRFYDMERDYQNLIESDTKNRTDAEKNKKNFDAEQQYELIKKKQDLKIKDVKIQDLYLKLIAEKLFKNVFDYESKIDLTDLYLSQSERLEKEKNALQQSLKEVGDKSPNIVNDNFIWSKTIPYLKDKVYEPAIKLKDIGKFKYFLNDEKVTRLLSYDNPENKKWSKNEIENEISIGEKSYEVIRRESIFKELQKLEKSILSKYNESSHPEELEIGGNPNFKKYIVNGILRKHSSNISEIDCKWLEDFDDKSFENSNSIIELKTKDQLLQIAFLLVLIRNKFAHNQLPLKDAYDYIIVNYPEVCGQTVSETLLNFVSYAVKYFSDEEHNI